jgi:hypothetical protein
MSEQTGQCSANSLIGVGIGIVFGAVVGPFLTGGLCVVVVLWLHWMAQ